MAFGLANLTFWGGGVGIRLMSALAVGKREALLHSPHVIK